MNTLRSPLETLSTASLPLTARTDYLQDETGLPKSDVLSFEIPGDRKFIVRPSGTEPKLKAYLFARATSQPQAEKELDILEKAVRSFCE